MHQSQVVRLMQTDGTVLGGGVIASHEVDPAALPATATYILEVEPAGGTTGSLTLTLSSDIVGTIGIDGAPVPTTINRPGQNARYTFFGAAGQRLGVGITPGGGLDGVVRVLQAGVNNLTGGNMDRVFGGDIEVTLPPAPDTYTLKVEPHVTTGSVTLTLSNDIVGTIGIDGAPIVAIINRAGQNARYTFTGAAGQFLGLGMTPAGPGGLSGVVSVFMPGGVLLSDGAGTMYSAASSDIDPVALPATGTYAIEVDPVVSTGSLTLTLSSDIVGAITTDGPPVSTTINRPGQNARYTFTGTAGQFLGVNITSGGLNGVVRVLLPNGDVLTGGLMFSSATSYFGVAVPSTGIYTLKAEPGVTTGSVTLALNRDWTATLSERVGGYELHDDACTELATSGDPITLVLRVRDDLVMHLHDHGLAKDVYDDPIEMTVAAFGKDPGSWFRDGSGCGYSEILRDDTEGHERCIRHILGVPFDTECLKSRLHVRGHTQSTPDPQYPTLSVTSLTPHFDVAIDPCDPITPTCRCDDQFAPLLYRKHLIPADFFGDGRSSFTAARDVLVPLWLASGHHNYVDSQNWGNVAIRKQCNDELTKANGVVVMLGTCGEIVSLPC